MPSGYPGTSAICSVDGCEKRTHSHGMCDRHWKQKRRKIDPVFKRRERRLTHRWQKRNKRRMKELRKISAPIWRQRVRDICYKAYGGYKCQCCGETERLFLTLDHINNDGAKHRKEIGNGMHLYLWLIKNNFPVGMIQVLCSNCNSGRARNNGVCPHKRRNK